MTESPSAGSDEEMLNDLQRETFDFFLIEVDPVTGLVVDSTRPETPASITVAGMAMSAYLVGVENGFLTRPEAETRIRKLLEFFAASDQSGSADSTGYQGFYFHFLEMRTGRRAWRSELSTVDTAFLIVGALSAAEYFDGDVPGERRIRELAGLLYRRVNWQWALNGGATLSHGWKPESGFLPYRWDREYSEAHLLYVLALGSPTFPIDPAGYAEWLRTYSIRKAYGIDYLYAGPLFIHQFSHIWIDFRGIQDGFTRKFGFDYFENSRRATVVHREYGIENPLGFRHYGEDCWGLTASDGPGPAILEVDGRRRDFFDYVARGAPFGPDDGTVSPWGVVASLPFAPDIVLPSIRNSIERLDLKQRRFYGFDASFNSTYPEKDVNPNGWVSPWRFGLNQGPIVLMIENFQTELLWKIMRKCPPLVRGLRRAGFSGGWLEAVGPETNGSAASRG